MKNAGPEFRNYATINENSRRPVSWQICCGALPSTNKAAVVVVTHDETIFDRFDRLLQFRNGRIGGGGGVLGHVGRGVVMDAPLREHLRSRESDVRQSIALMRPARPVGLPAMGE